MAERASLLDELWEVVRAIPKGKVCSYGEIGRSLPRPVSGYLVGKWMASAPGDVPWWRVVGKDGDLLVAKRDPRLAELQAEALLREGHKVEGGRVRGEDVWWGV